MSKKRQSTFRRLTRHLATGIVLFFSVAPVLLAVFWLYVGVVHSDSRPSAQTVAFQPRLVDGTSLVPRLFKEPIVSISFDDGWESVYTAAFPVLQKYGLYSTQYIIADALDDSSYMSVAQLHQMQLAGTEIGSHTVTHPDLTTLNVAELNYELAKSQQILQKDFQVPVRDFTSPFGAYNAYTLAQIGQYYRSQKNAEGSSDLSDGIDTTINEADDFNPYNFTSFSIKSDTTLQQIQELLDEAWATNGWLVLTYHQIDDSDTTYSVTPQVFAQQIKLISQSPIRSATVGQVMDAFQAGQSNGNK